MKLYIHTGKGHYIGSTAIVIAENIMEASAIIREKLDKTGLKDEPLNIIEKEIKKNELIYFNDGDY